MIYKVYFLIIDPNDLFSAIKIPPSVIDRLHYIMESESVKSRFA